MITMTCPNNATTSFSLGYAVNNGDAVSPQLPKLCRIHCEDIYYNWFSSPGISCVRVQTDVNVRDDDFPVVMVSSSPETMCMYEQKLFGTFRTIRASVGMYLMYIEIHGIKLQYPAYVDYLSLCVCVTMTRPSLEKKSPCVPSLTSKLCVPNRREWSGSPYVGKEWIVTNLPKVWKQPSLGTQMYHVHQRHSYRIATRKMYSSSEFIYIVDANFHHISLNPSVPMQSSY
jgi:hypothetical protein